MFVPLIIGSDKTTVSVATGHTEYHPLYLSIGNIFNSVQRAHRNGVVLVGFLAIPKSESIRAVLVQSLIYTVATKEHANNVEYHNFRRQLFQCSLAKIFESVKPYMTTHDIARCSDGHYRRVIYGLGPYIADYPEQVLLSGVVQGWCPKYVSTVHCPIQAALHLSISDAIKDVLPIAKISMVIGCVCSGVESIVIFWSMNLSMRSCGLSMAL